ncbi:DnaJ domain-containing protein [Allorhizobium sp. BGMRC 0089]|uniref:DnaJ C-terminal domain-containing protein n=1 Tax=Allorhizobium sonneratiae TaxID=2934936 RepID=UPI002033BFF6|nr:DnaJ C-terminal domain-containing protein [Allorhizobium sonneratiae]MCM2294521.1 DnaJ domain-containing protein [Allorhizobium sonneratiae]
MRDPYSLLGVKRDAGADEIKAAWRAKAKSSHPDQNRDDPGATERFAELGQAYDLLKDPEKRNRYDQKRAQLDAMKREQTIMQQREEARAAAERARQARANAERIMAELARIEAEKAKAEKAAENLAAKVEAARARASDAQAQASRAEKTADPEKAAKTAKTAEARDEAKPSSPEPDATEDAINRIFGATASAGASPASGAASGTASRDEPLDDHGNEQARGRGFGLPVIGLFSSIVRLIRKPAPVPEKAPDIMVDATIAVEDLIKQSIITVALSDGRDLRVPLEPGHTDGSILRLAGKGLKVQGMTTGDVVVTLRVLSGGPFRVNGYDLHCDLPVTLDDAVLGVETEIQGPSGSLAVIVPPWSGSERRIVVPQQGLPSAPQERGDLIVEVRVVFAPEPDEKITDLIKLERHGLYI